VPRKSQAAIDFEPFTRPPAEQKTSIRPPGDVPDNVGGLMTDILATQPADHWRSGDEFLIEQYAQSIVAAREAHLHLQSEGYILETGKVNPWAVIWEKATRASVALAAKLRLSPQQRHDAKRAARERDRDQYGNPVGRWR
jgi:hypothetical protein